MRNGLKKSFELVFLVKFLPRLPIMGKASSYIVLFGLVAEKNVFVITSNVVSFNIRNSSWIKISFKFCLCFLLDVWLEYIVLQTMIQF